MAYRIDRFDPAYSAAEDDLSDWHIDRWDHAPAYLFTGIYIVAWLAMLPSGGMASWGVSAQTIAVGRAETVALHMFAHAGLIHLSYNSLAMLGLGAALASLLGDGAGKWARFMTILFGGSLIGALAFLLLHPHGTVPLVGASGGLFAFLGMLARTPTQHGPLAPLFSQDTRAAAWEFLKSNAWLMIIFTLPPLILGREGGLAWEAHLGGFLFGLLSAPLFVRPKPLMLEQPIST